MSRRRKFSYIELLALMGFQILLFLAFMDRVSDVDSIYKHGTILRLTIPDYEPNNDSSFIKFSATDILKEWKRNNKKIITVDLTSDNTDDQKRLNFIRNEARRLEYTYDTTEVLKVHFLDENTYGQFVTLISMLHADKHKRYMLFKNDLYISGSPPPEPIDSSKIITFKLDL